MRLDLIGEPTGSVKETMDKLDRYGIPVTINGNPSDQSVVLVLMSALEGPTQQSRSYIEKWKGKNVFLAGILLTDAEKINDNEILELVHLETAELTGSADGSPQLLLSNDKNLIDKVKRRAANPSKIFAFGTSSAASKPWWKFW